MTVQMMKLVIHFHALEIHELLSSAMLDTDVKIPARINGLSAKLTKKVGKVLRNLEWNMHIQLPLVGNNEVVNLPTHTSHSLTMRKKQRASL